MPAGAFRSVSLPSDLVEDVDAALAEGRLRVFGARSKPQAIEIALRRLLADAGKGVA